MPTLLKKYHYLFILLLLFFLAICSHQIFGEQKEDKQVLRQLLKELRELRKTNVTLHNQWQREKQQLESSLLLDTKKTEKIQKQHDIQQKSIEDKKKKYQKKERKNQAREKSLTEIEQWISRQYQQILENERQTILLDNKRKKELKKAREHAIPVTAQLTSYLRFMQMIALQSLETETYSRIIKVRGESLLVDIIRLGGAVEFFIAPDNQMAGVRKANDPPEFWVLLEKEQIPALRQTIRVMKKKVPPELVVVPLPPSIIIKE